MLPLQCNHILEKLLKGFSAKWSVENISPVGYFWLFLTSLTSVRVFTRMVSDHPWCSLWVFSSLIGTSHVTVIFSCLNIHIQTSLSDLDFQNNDFLRLATTDQSVASLLGLCYILLILQGEGHKSSQADAGKYKIIFCFMKIAVFLKYREIYVHICVIIKQPTQHTGVCILSKMKLYWLKFHASRERLWLEYFCRTTWYLYANRSKVVNSRWLRLLFICIPLFLQTLWRNMK